MRDAVEKRNSLDRNKSNIYSIYFSIPSHTHTHTHNFVFPNFHPNLLFEFRVGLNKKTKPENRNFDYIPYTVVNIQNPIYWLHLSPEVYI